jgi:HK97 family phage prohead protease
VTGKLETRRFADGGLEVRESSRGLQLVGYASRTERAYPVGNFEETIARNAFRSTLARKADVVLLINHGEGGGMPLARTKSGSLRLSEDARGLRVEADLQEDDPDVRALIPKMRRSDVDEMSFAFRVPPGGDEWSKDRSRRLITAVDLHKGDVSIVTYGANDASTAELLARSAFFRDRSTPVDSIHRARRRLAVLRAFTGAR